ncbi:universal stress protein [Ralstonia solanacearum]|uniref:universal stress protein n=2 Tax=Ralstonia solanacearum TaxID=305 RepID=UPI0001816F74|nr:universal stress protein [Ralstonia solanacearum]MDC6177466.1 universal stress protein [Ralstonia solanacearum]MDC6208747.1 universal stress protein [Ralstonia solanacearum]MDC6240577.1 universal stress protein [Ralstonia solanacearum]MDD7800693.1 universal stress protein [Ralstonia solanacearum]TYZ55377.1 universal stress protein [Ralstonia solanacearum]
MLKLLVPVNGSRHALDAVRHAAFLYRDRCASGIVLLNVQEPIEGGRASAYHRLETLRQLEEQSGEDALRLARRILDDAGAHYVAQIKVGPVAETIAQTAAANACDMIVMGTAGRTRLGSLMAGGLSNRLIRMSRVPVTLVK